MNKYKTMRRICIGISGYLFLMISSFTAGLYVGSDAQRMSYPQPDLHKQ